MTWNTTPYLIRAKKPVREIVLGKTYEMFFHIKAQVKDPMEIAPSIRTLQETQWEIVEVRQWSFSDDGED